MKNPDSSGEQPAGTERKAADHELPTTHFEREDDRWRWQNQLHDWMLVLIMVAVYLIWTGIVYFLEPGIR